MVVYDVVRVGPGSDSRLQYLLIATGATFDDRVGLLR
jgi:hypothetical protein